jgi:hypothetical protein
MRETCLPRASILDFYSKHEILKQLSHLSMILDEPVLTLTENDLVVVSKRVGRCGLSF